MNPNNEYTADKDGIFYVKKEDLPEDKDLSERSGITASVTYEKSGGVRITDESAPNTYVPNRMFVRLRLANDPVIDGSYIRFTSIVVERRTDGGDWKMIPSYLGDLHQDIFAYPLKNYENPASYDDDAVSYTADVSNILISSSSAVRVNRLRKRASYFRPVSVSAIEWDGNDHYFTLVLKSYYGENLHLDAVIKMAPVQAMPMIMNVKTFTYTPPNASLTGFFNRIEGEMDIAGANIDYNLLFKSALKKESKTTGGLSYTYYSPEIETKSVADNSKQFIVRFNITGSNMNNTGNQASIVSPGFNIGTPHIGASVLLECSSPYFFSLNTIGYLRFTTGVDVDLKIESRERIVDGWIYVFSDIGVMYTP